MGEDNQRITFSKLLGVLLFVLLMIVVFACTVMTLELKSVHRERERMNLIVGEMNSQLDQATMRDKDTLEKLNELSTLCDQLQLEVEKNRQSEETQAGSMEEGASHKVYLTFDDGPSKNTREILDILDRYQVKATFFVLGKEDKESIALLKEIADRGHSIGMHSYSHQYETIYSSLDAFIEDYYKISDYIYDNVGIRSNIYRFPGGSSNTVSNISMIEAARYLSGSGVVYFDWNVSSGDAETKPISKNKLIENCTLNIEKREHSVILLHDTASKTTTVEALPELIESLLSMEDTEILPITADTPPVQHIRVN